MMPDTTRHLLEIAGTAGNLISAPGDDNGTSTRRLGAGLLSMAIVLMPISLRERTGGISREDKLELRRELPGGFLNWAEFLLLLLFFAVVRITLPINFPYVLKSYFLNN